MDTELLQPQLRVLHLEDSENDHALVVEMLLADGLKCEFTLAKSKAEFYEALQADGYNLIISDYSLPSYDGLSALAAARELHPATPFIFFSGTIGEDVAVESLKHGAVDYVLKQRPSRLIAAVRRAVRNAREHERLKQTENALRDSEERFRVIARATNDVVWEWDIQSNLVSFSSNLQAAFGHAMDAREIAFERWFDFIHPDDKQRAMSGISSLLATGGRVWWSEHRMRRANGSYAYIFDRASVIYDAAGKPQRMVGVMIDMSERKESEEKIREQAALLDKARDAIIVCTLDREIIFWNQGAERIYGWSNPETMGKNIWKLLFRGELPLPVLDAEKKLDECGEWLGELQACTKAGKPVMVHTRSTLIRDDQGQPKNILIISTDITEHKQLEEQFLRAQRLESLGALVSGIAHDLNNMLVPIIIGVEILKTQSLSEDVTGMVATMETSARRSVDMVKQMLLFARGGESSKSLVWPDQLVKEMGRIITDTFPKSIDYHLKAGNNLHSILAIPTQIHQVLMNLCVNARDAMSGNGTLTLTVENVQVDAAEAARQTGARPGTYVCISVTDTGAGIPAEQLEKIFQPFFTTKAPGKGTGLGLSTCQSIVKKHDGFITVHSQVGTGTEFKIYLPAAGVKPLEPAAVGKPAPSPGHGERILVVDDENSVLAISRAALENYGYLVDIAESGMEATAYFRKNSDVMDLVIIDYAMPLMDGQATVSALRKIRPDIKVIVASVSEKEAEDVFQNFQADGLIFKPFTTEKLLAVVSQVLAAKTK